jgi:hypothetical protein
LTTGDSRFQTSQGARELLGGHRYDSYLYSLLFGLGQAFEVRLPFFVFAAEDCVKRQGCAGKGHSSLDCLGIWV